MLAEIKAQLAVYIGLIGATIAAAIGVVARHVYNPDGFAWARVAIEFPFAILVALIAGGFGTWLELPSIVIYGLSGSAGYLGPHFLADWLRRKAGDDGDGDDGQT